jgi:hypothetical protein
MLLVTVSLGTSLLEAREGVHSLVEALTTNRVRVAEPQRGRKGVVRTEEGEKSIDVSYIRSTLLLAAIRAHTPCWAGWRAWVGGNCSNGEGEGGFGA